MKVPLAATYPYVLKWSDMSDPEQGRTHYEYHGSLFSALEARDALLQDSIGLVNPRIEATPIPSEDAPF